MFLVKNGYNAKSSARLILDGKWLYNGRLSRELHSRVKEFQIADLLNNHVKDGTYKKMGPISKMSVSGQSLDPAIDGSLGLRACADILRRFCDRVGWLVGLLVSKVKLVARQASKVKLGEL